jgi:CYTH domain-containing protein
MSSQRIGKYACLEIEHRYLLVGLPADLAQDGGWRITDRYFPGTRLRLRRMQSIGGDEVIYKLTQKYRTADQSALETTITNIYLSEAEYNLLLPLKALTIEKRRYPYETQAGHISIDVFAGRHKGLILAEMEGGAESVLPPFALADVTEDAFFGGGHLAGLADLEFRQGLARRLSEYAR